MFFIIYFILAFLFFLPKKSMFLTFVSCFFGILSTVLIIYYLILMFFIIKNREKILKTYSVPGYIFSSKIDFKNIFKNFFLSNITLNLITDKQNIVFKCNKNNFYTPPFFAGKHNIKSFYLKFSDPFNFFTIKKQLNIKTFYNFFIQNKTYQINFFNNDKNDEIKEKKIKDDSIILRDYLAGDDPRKIFWKAYALSDELKIREDWFEKSSQKKIKIALDGLYNLDYYFLTEHLLKKLFLYIIKLFNSGFDIVVFDKNIENKYIYMIEKQIYDLLESNFDKNIIKKERFDILFFSSFEKNEFNSNNYVFLSCTDFFTKGTLESIKHLKKIPSKSIKRYFSSDFYKLEKSYSKKYKKKLQC